MALHELVAIGPREPKLVEYEPPPLGPGMVRVISEFGAPKHGTELMGYRNVAATSARRYDPEWRCFMPRTDGSSRFPMRLGNTIVGQIAEVGEGVAAFAPDDRVYGHLPLREVHVVPAERVRPLPPELSPEAAVCVDPADAALAMRDAHVRLGDRVAVFGLGAIGLMALQYCRLSGASLVIAVDPIPLRRSLAHQLGADVVLDPADGDVGLEIRRLTGKLGVDVALEVSGNSRALHQAVRATRFEGTVGVIASYPGFADALRLGDEFHWNAIHLVSCRTVSLPLRDYGWDRARILDLAEDLIRTGRLRTEGIVQPIVPFEECDEAYRQIDEHPETCIKLGVRFQPAT
ncbi:MAG: zinc-binding alcohol dehydrogenase [Chloroflexi bacterium]|nr:zinc-binding alcohol dehydrogenase [Chloroflexota bacterium]